ncbi:MAG TPA: hypothetical protein VIK18_21900 [Pirellulales bacterium]
MIASHQAGRGSVQQGKPGRKSVAAWVAGLLALAAWAGDDRPACAVPPWQKVSLFKHIEADSDKPYPLTDAQGPWLVMALTFTGPEAQQQAQELVYELRSVWKLPAYTHQMNFDFGHGAGRGVDKYGAPLKMRYRRTQASEVAVLVGDYPTADDPEAQKTLKRLKYMVPDCMNPEKLKREGRSPPPAAWRWVVEHTKNANPNQRKGPMGQAFIVANPLLPDEYFRPKGIDKLVYELNKPIKHSLLECQGKYTVKVATFTGQLITDQNEIKAVEAGKKMESHLEEAALKAHKLCEALRAKGYEAFEFHDRYSSIVTVGSFDSVGSPRADGKIEINPQIHTIMQTFGADKSVVPGRAAPTVGKPKQIDGIALDIQPLPVEVPQKNIVVNYDRSIVGRR